MDVAGGSKSGTGQAVDDPHHQVAESVYAPAMLASATSTGISEYPTITLRRNRARSMAVAHDREEAV